MTSREIILQAGLDILRSGGTVSLESAAREACLTKPGLMYHFGTKEALMLALVDTVVDEWERQLRRRLGADPSQVTAAQRVEAYLDWCLSGGFDAQDLVMLTDPRLRSRLTERWKERFEEWFDVPEDTPAAVRGRLAAVRLLADGAKPRVVSVERHLLQRLSANRQELLVAAR